MELMGELLFKLSKIGLLVSTLWILLVIGVSFMYFGSVQEEIDRIKGKYYNFSLVIPLVILFLSTLVFIICK